MIHTKNIREARLVMGAADKDGLRWCTDTDAIGLRPAGAADELIQLNHNGWYNRFDDWDSAYRGAVWRLPHGRCLAGFTDSDNDGAATLDCSVTYDAPEDAARVADSLAQNAAEHAREWDTAWHAGAMWAEYQRQIAQSRDRLRALLAERRAARGTGDYPAICTAIEDSAWRLIDSILELRQACRTLARGEGMNGSYEYGFLPSPEHYDAFNDGAEERVLVY